MTTQVYITDYGGSEAYLGDFESYFGMKVDFYTAKSWLFAGGFVLSGFFNSCSYYGAENLLWLIL
ncbi:MAG: hypothetical protein ACFKPT_26790 [Gloeotrichia echinulata GP01]